MPLELSTRTLGQLKALQACLEGVLATGARAGAAGLRLEVDAEFATVAFSVARGPAACGERA